MNVAFELRRRAINIAPDRALGQEAEPPRGLVDPRGGCRREVHVIARLFGSRARIRLVLCAAELSITTYTLGSAGTAVSISSRKHQSSLDR